MTVDSNIQPEPTDQATSEDYTNFLIMARQSGPGCGGGTPGKFAVHKVFFAEHKALEDLEGRYVPVEPTNIRPAYLGFLAGILKPVLDAATAAAATETEESRRALKVAIVNFFRTASTNMDMEVINGQQATYFRDWHPLESLVRLVTKVQADCKDEIIPVVANTQIKPEETHDYKPGDVTIHAGRKYRLHFTWTPFPTDAAWKPPIA
jgi:hypothetical protein